MEIPPSNMDNEKMVTAEELRKCDLDYSDTALGDDSDKSQAVELTVNRPITEDEYIDVVHVSDDEEPQKLYEKDCALACMKCGTSYLQRRKRWVACTDEACIKVLCRKCENLFFSIRTKTPCIVCGALYTGGPHKYLRCVQCHCWKCPACANVSCRCIVRSEWSHHNF